MRKNILVVTKGHPFDKPAFFALFDSMRGLTWTHVEQPAALHLFQPEAAKDFAAFVLYDVPGIEFRTPAPPLFRDPPEHFRQGFETLLEAGYPLVFLHHAIAGWPAWDGYAEAIGARFFYQPGAYKGRAYPDSGYVFPVKHRLSPVAAHPVTAGLEDGFEIEDELYLFQMLEDDIVPLMRSDHRFTHDEFYSAASALKAKMWSREGWEHPEGTNLVAWARRARNSPIVVIQCGNDASAYGNEGFQKLLRNAIDWVMSEEARTWARHR